MPKTISTARSLEPLRNAPDFWRKLAGLLQALATVEGSFAVGGPAGVPAGLLRGLIILTAG